MKSSHVIILILLLFSFCCKTDDNNGFNGIQIIEDSNDGDDEEEIDNDNEDPNQSLRILSLGNSYTIGTGVCETCSYPKQLRDSLTLNLNPENPIELNVVAASGWTTSSLLAALNAIETQYTYDLVTLLIGVNNQFQHLPFSLFETDFDALISRAFLEGRADKSNIIVISIPDYAFSPFGQSTGNPETTSAEIDLYNNYIETYCVQNDITYLNITDISREGLDNPDLIADDGLHLSEMAYALIAERLLPIAIEKLN